LVYLANAYRSVGRLREAEATYKEAIGAYRELAAYGPDAYESPRYSPSADESIAMTLENLADLYRAMQRPTEADATCAELRALVAKRVSRLGVSTVCKQEMKTPRRRRRLKGI